MIRDPRQVIGPAASIGFVVYGCGRFKVHCAACGKGLATDGFDDAIYRARVIKALRKQGWSNGGDKLWRCPNCQQNKPTLGESA